jgi:hypothetical protein
MAAISAAAILFLLEFFQVFIIPFLILVISFGYALWILNLRAPTKNSCGLSSEGRYDNISFNFNHLIAKHMPSKINRTIQVITALIRNMKAQFAVHQTKFGSSKCQNLLNL